MKKNTTRKSSYKQYSITDSILFNYWNENTWEFEIKHETLDEQTSMRYMAYAAALVEAIAPHGVQRKRIPDFIDMCQTVFALPEGDCEEVA